MQTGPGPPITLHEYGSLEPKELAFGLTVDECSFRLEGLPQAAGLGLYVGLESGSYTSVTAVVFTPRGICNAGT